ncbi:MAG: dicarboxylate/amino acid:cation symporter [Elusimicrobiales bacterium]|jgi:DAACS family dicarboxylate/amino acid:cation (Na+ or H+) symporter|nr:dicarboxylate/amino acid:cation symporter [Elusimicrobiales bacterium]
MTSGKSPGPALHTKILAGLLIGGVLGLLANTQLGGHHPLVDWVNRYLAYPAGQVFLRMLFMIVMPLVFASIALGVAGLGDLRKVGRVGGKAIGYFLATTFLAASTGLVFVNMAKPGAGLDPEVKAGLMEAYSGAASEKVSIAKGGGFGVDTFVNIVTRNPVKSAADGDLLGLIFFALVFGAALTLIPAGKARPMLELLEAVNAAVIAIVGMAMKLAPYGVTALIFGVTSRFGLALLAPLGGYILVVLGALLFHAAVNMSLVLRFAVGLSPAVFFDRVRSALITAFSTSSSSATLPAALSSAEQGLGVPPQVAGFVLPIGSTMCMNGTSIFEGVTVIFLCQVFGVDLTLGQMVAVVVMAVITAIGAAGVPGGSIPLMVGIMAMFGVPGEAIAIVLGVDRILDMSRTTVNVYGDISAVVFVARSEGVWKPSMVPPAEKAPA